MLLAREFQPGAGSQREETEHRPGWLAGWQDRWRFTMT